MDRKYLTILLPGAILVAVTVWLTYPESKTKSIGDPSKYRFMHCPECKRESIYSPSAFEKGCRDCDKSLIGTETSIKQNGTVASPFNRMFLYVFVELVA